MNKKYLIFIVLLSLVICILAASLAISNHKAAENIKLSRRLAEAQSVVSELRSMQDIPAYGIEGLAGGFIEDGKLIVSIDNMFDDDKKAQKMVEEHLREYMDLIVFNRYDSGDIIDEFKRLTENENIEFGGAENGADALITVYVKEESDLERAKEIAYDLSAKYHVPIFVEVGEIILAQVQNKTPALFGRTYE